MNRRIALLISFIGLNLMACCCGGVGNAPPRQNVNAQPGGGDPVAMKEWSDTPEPAKEEPKGGERPGPKIDRRPEPQKKTDTPKTEPEQEDGPRFIPPPLPNYPPPPSPPPPPWNVKPVLVSKVGTVTAQLTSATVGTVTYERNTVTGKRELQTERQLVIKVKLVNKGTGTIVYYPWNAVPSEKSKATMKDQRGAYYEPWFIGQASWIPGGISKRAAIPDGDYAEDVIAFEPPTFSAERFEVSLPASNCGLGLKAFTFVFGRTFFEDAKKREADVAARFARAQSDHAKLIENMKGDYADRLANAKAYHAAQVDAARRARLQAEAKAAEEREAAKTRGISRANYEKIRLGMTMKEVVNILGPGEEVLNAGGIRTFRWRVDANFFFDGIGIGLTFEDGVVVAKAIRD
jgi:hypothetical protein